MAHKVRWFRTMQDGKILIENLTMHQSRIQRGEKYLWGKNPQSNNIYERFLLSTREHTKKASHTKAAPTAIYLRCYEYTMKLVYMYASHWARRRETSDGFLEWALWCDYAYLRTGANSFLVPGTIKREQVHHYGTSLSILNPFLAFFNVV